MRNITKSDEGTIVWAKPCFPNDQSPVQKRKILRVWEDADSYEFKYGDWAPAICGSDGFSKKAYCSSLSGWKIAETIARYDQPLNFWREVKIAVIRAIRLLMERLEFNLKNS